MICARAKHSCTNFKACAKPIWFHSNLRSLYSSATKESLIDDLDNCRRNAKSVRSCKEGAKEALTL